MTDMEYSLYCIYDTIEILKLSCENGNLIGTEHSRVAEVNSLNSGKLPGCFFFERPRYEAKWVGVWVNVCVCSQTTGRNVPTSWRMLSVNTRHWLKGQGTSHRVVCQEAPGMVHHSQGQGFKSSWKILCQVTLASASHKNESKFLLIQWPCMLSMLYTHLSVSHEFPCLLAIADRTCAWYDQKWRLMLASFPGSPFYSLGMRLG